MWGDVAIKSSSMSTVWGVRKRVIFRHDKSGTWTEK